MKVRKAVIPAAGLGTRFLPATKAQPKEMVPLVDTPIIQLEPRGLGHAILQVRQHVGNEPFAVLLGDEVFVGEPPGLGELIEIHELVGGTIIATREVAAAEEAPSRLAIVGRYIIDPAVFDILAHLQREVASTGQGAAAPRRRSTPPQA